MILLSLKGRLEASGIKTICNSDNSLVLPELSSVSVSLFLSED